MPVTSRFIGGKYRVVEAETGKIAKNASGTAVDGGGYTTEAEAKRQVRAINANKE